MSEKKGDNKKRIDGRGWWSPWLVRVLALLIFIFLGWFISIIPSLILGEELLQKEVPSIFQTKIRISTISNICSYLLSAFVALFLERVLEAVISIGINMDKIYKDLSKKVSEEVVTKVIEEFKAISSVYTTFPIPSAEIAGQETRNFVCKAMGNRRNTGWGVLKAVSSLINVNISNRPTVRCRWTDYKKIIRDILLETKGSLIWTLYGTPLMENRSFYTRDGLLTDQDEWFADWKYGGVTGEGGKYRIVIFAGGENGTTSLERVKKYKEDRTGRRENFERTSRENNGSLYFTTKEIIVGSFSNIENSIGLDFGCFDQEVFVTSGHTKPEGWGPVSLKLYDNNMELDEGSREHFVYELLTNTDSLKGRILFESVDDLLRHLSEGGER